MCSNVQNAGVCTKLGPGTFGQSNNSTEAAGFVCTSGICNGTIVKLKTGRQHEETHPMPTLELLHSYRLSKAYKVKDKM